MKRLFVGIRVSEELKLRLRPLLESLKRPGLNLVSLDHLHLTLKFLGEVKESKIEEIEQKLKALNH